MSAGQRVNDGLWHSVQVDAGGLQVRLTLDGEPATAIQLWTPLEPGGSFFLGGERRRWGRRGLAGLQHSDF